MAAVKYGFMNRSAMSGIAALPQPFSTFVACYGDFRVFLVFAVMMIVAIAIWYPFLMVWDRKCLRGGTGSDRRRSGGNGGIKKEGYHENYTFVLRQWLHYRNDDQKDAAGG